MVREAERVLGASQEHVRYPETKLPEHSNQVLSKDAEVANEREGLLKLKRHVMSLLADLQPARAQNTTNKDLLQVVKIALALQKKGYQQLVTGYVKESEKLVADNAAIDAESRRYSTDMDTLIGQLQTSLGN